MKFGERLSIHRYCLYCFIHNLCSFNLLGYMDDSLFQFIKFHPPTRARSIDYLWKSSNRTRSTDYIRKTLIRSRIRHASFGTWNTISGVCLLVGAGRADAEQLAVGFFGKHDPGSRVEQGEPHGNAVAVGTGVGIPVFAFQKDHFYGSCIFFHNSFSAFLYKCWLFSAGFAG